jgi:hypothetical protein
VSEIPTPHYIGTIELERRHAARRAKRLEAKDFHGYLKLFDGHERFRPFLKIHRQLSDADYWQCLALVWDNIEVSYPDRFCWLMLFQSNRPGRHLLMSRSEHRTLAALPEVLTVFRGYAKSKGRNGLSWTLTESRARFFAIYASGPRRRYLCRHVENRPGMVVIGRCFKRDVLAYFDGRGEQEVVIAPDKVKLGRSYPIPVSTGAAVKECSSASGHKQRSN